MAVGYQAGLAITTGDGNVFIGNLCGDAATDIDSTVAIGYLALSSAHTQDYTVAIGGAAGENLTSGQYNTLIGGEAAKDMTTGDKNTVLGYKAGYGIAAGNNPDGNTFIGMQAGNSVTTGSYNTMIGIDSDTNAVGDSNSTAVGNGATGTGSNTVSLGNTSISNIEGQVSFGTYSDERIKKSITDTDIGLDFIKELKPRKFKRVDPKDYPEAIQTKYDKRAPELENPDKVHDGLIAQEVKETMESMGVSFSGWNESDNSKQKLQYATFVMPLIKAVQELSEKNEALEKRIEELEG